MNKEFENLPEIAKLIKDCDIWWCKKSQRYLGSDIEVECYANGAWYAYQEQQSLKTEAYITLGESLNHGSRAYEDAIYEAMNILRESKDDTATNQG